MAMTKKMGKTLQAGVDASPVSGTHAQSGSRSAGGEVKVFYDEDGVPISVYNINGNKVYRWTALMESDVADKAKGDEISISGVTDRCYVEEWEVTMSNDDVKRVNITAATLPGLAADTPAAQSATPATGDGN